MTTPPVRRSIPALVLGLVAALPLIGACSGDDDPTIGTLGLSSVPPTGDLVVPVGTGDIPMPVGTGDLPVPTPVISSDGAIPNLITIEVTVGVDSGPERLERIPLGASVAIVATNPTSDDEFHLHGYELGDGQPVTAGQPKTFTFIANQAGEFELESHETGDVLLVLTVA